MPQAIAETSSAITHTSYTATAPTHIVPAIGGSEKPTSHIDQSTASGRGAETSASPARTSSGETHTAVSTHTSHGVDKGPVIIGGTSALTESHRGDSHSASARHNGPAVIGEKSGASYYTNSGAVRTDTGRRMPTIGADIHTINTHPANTGRVDIATLAAIFAPTILETGNHSASTGLTTRSDGHIAPRGEAGVAKPSGFLQPANVDADYVDAEYRILPNQTEPIASLGFRTVFTHKDFSTTPSLEPMTGPGTRTSPGIMPEARSIPLTAPALEQVLRDMPDIQWNRPETAPFQAPTPGTEPHQMVAENPSGHIKSAVTSQNGPRTLAELGNELLGFAFPAGSEVTYCPTVEYQTEYVYLAPLLDLGQLYRGLRRFGRWLFAGGQPRHIMNQPRPVAVPSYDVQPQPDYAPQIITDPTPAPDTKPERQTAPQAVPQPGTMPNAVPTDWTVSAPDPTFYSWPNPYTNPSPYPNPAEYPQPQPYPSPYASPDSSTSHTTATQQDIYAETIRLYREMYEMWQAGRQAQEQAGRSADSVYRRRTNVPLLAPTLLLEDHLPTLLEKPDDQMLLKRPDEWLLLAALESLRLSNRTTVAQADTNPMTLDFGSSQYPADPRPLSPSNAFRARAQAYQEAQGTLRDYSPPPVTIDGNFRVIPADAPIAMNPSSPAASLDQTAPINVETVSGPDKPARNGSDVLRAAAAARPDTQSRITASPAINQTVETRAKKKDDELTTSSPRSPKPARMIV
jgi:hypothetical protein